MLAAPVNPHRLLEQPVGRQVDITGVLSTRPSRIPDYKAEIEAFGHLAEVLATHPEKMVEALAQTALDLTSAHSAGLSLADDAQGIFRWVATAGAFEKYLNGTMPRHFSPCGEVLSRNTAILMTEPVKAYPYIDQLDRPLREVLLVPFHQDGVPIGTVWVISHEGGKMFDEEDLRIVRGLTRFAAAAVQTVGLVDGLRKANADKERALAETRQHVEELEQWFDQAPGFVAVLRGPDHVFEMANRAYVGLVGGRDVVGKPVMAALPELQGQGFEDLLDRVYESGEAFIGREVPIKLVEPDGTTSDRFLDFLYQPTFDQEGRPNGIFVQGHECTDRKRSMDALRQADAHKDQFLAMLGHELRGPLSPIKVAVQILRHTSAPLDPRHQKSLEIIERQAGQLTSLIDDLTDVASIRSGKLQMRFDKVVLQDVIARALETCAPALAAKGHRLSVDLPEMPVTLSGDLLRLTQVISNLVLNAVKYTPDAGAIEIGAVVRDDRAEIRIVDTGIGIAAHLLPKVFDLFMQVPADQRPHHSGLGIGLALVKQFVELHQGRVTVSSDGLGCGSTFVVTLPIVRRYNLASQAMPSPEFRAPSTRSRTAGSSPHRGARATRA